VIDDGSWDSSPQTSPSDAGVKLIPYPTKKGLAAARSTALCATCNELLTV